MTDDRTVIARQEQPLSGTAITEMTQLIEATRAYEANVRMIQNQDQTLGSLMSRLLKA